MATPTPITPYHCTSGGNTNWARHELLTGASVTLYDGLGSDKLQEVSVATLKWRFFALGLRAGVALQMFLVCVSLVLLQASSGGAMHQLSSLYYPLFRALFLLSLFGVLFGLLLFTWKRCGVDYTLILGVDGGRTNYHAVLCAASTLMSLNFVAFMVYWLTLTANLTPYTHTWPAIAIVLSLAYLTRPGDWQPEWRDGAQRAALLRAMGRALGAPFTESSFASSFVADVLTSMPKLFIDLLNVGCIYLSGEALASGAWNPQLHAFEHQLETCTDATPGYHALFVCLSILPFYVRMMQCAREIYDVAPRSTGSRRWRRHGLNALKYATSITVIILSLVNGRSGGWVAASVASTLFAFAWDVLVDWGLGPQPVRRAVRALIGEPLYAGEECEGAAYWLRPIRGLPTHWYAAGMLADLTCRLSWAVYISPGQRVVAANATLLLGAIELGRRAMWGLFRLEWEQIRLKSVEVHRELSSRRSPSPRRRGGRGAGSALAAVRDQGEEEEGEEDATPHDPQEASSLINAALQRNMRRMRSGAALLQPLLPAAVGNGGAAGRGGRALSVTVLPQR